MVGQLKNGETLVRTGRNDSTGWSRLEYNGQTVYAVSAYLTTDLTYKTPEKPTYPNRVSTQDGRVIVFTDCDDYITPKDLINLRTEPSTSEGESTVRTQVRNGTNLHRTGYSERSGWSRVEYNGEILYAVTSYVISGSARNDRRIRKIECKRSCTVGCSFFYIKILYREKYKGMAKIISVLR